MIKLIIGFVLGLAVATVGFGGLAKLADNGINTAKSTIQEQVSGAKTAVSELSPELQAAISKELAEARAKK